MINTLKKQRLFFISLIGIVVVSLIMGTTFAYQTITMNETEKRDLVIQAGTLSVAFTKTNVISNTNMKLVPDYSYADYTEFKIDNTASTSNVAFQIDLIDLDYGYIDTATGDEFEGCLMSGTSYVSCLVDNNFKYTLVEVTNGTEKIVSDGSFNGLSTTTPITKSKVISDYSIIEKGKTKTFRLYLWFKETQNSQNKLENTYFYGKLNVTSLFSEDVNPFGENKDTLAYNLLNSAINVTNGTRFMTSPPTIVSKEISSQNWEVGTINIYMSSDATLTYYSSDETDLWNCADGYWDEESEEWITDCSNATEITSSTKCEDYKGMYVWDEWYLGSFKIIDCDENGEPVIGKAESVLSQTEDDYGTSYYYRGQINDNYINFADMCWRIVRVDGDGNIKLILEDQDNICEESNGNWNIPASDGTTITYQSDGTTPTIVGNFGYDNSRTSTNGNTMNLLNYLNPVTNSNVSMVNAFKYFQKSFTSEELGKLQSGNWCLDDVAYSAYSINISTATPLTSAEKETKYLARTSFYYDSYVRLYSYNTYGTFPTLKCNGTSMNVFSDGSSMYVGTLTADEVVFAGAKMSSTNENYYLINGYQYDNGLSWKTLTPYYYSYGSEAVFNVSSYFSSSSVHSNNSFRPAILLKSGVEIETGGNGTKNNPYVIK